MGKDDDFSLGFEDSLFELSGSVAEPVASSVVKTESPVSSVARKDEKPQSVSKKESETGIQSGCSYKTVYEWFVKDKTPSIDFDQHLRSKPEVYILFGLVPFQTLPDDICLRSEAFERKCHAEVDKYMQGSNEAIRAGELIKACATQIKNIFNYYDFNNFEVDLKKNLYDRLYVSLREKVLDGILEPAEIETILTVAKQIYLWDGKSEDIRQEILAWVKEKSSDDNFKIESYRETFIRNVRKKPTLEILDAPQCMEKLYMYYRVLKCTEQKIYSKQLEIDEKALHDEMQSVLTENKLLKDREQTYLNEFFNIEKARSGKDYSLKLPSDYYQFLKTIALRTYLFTEDLWTDFARRERLSKLNDVSVAFIMGTEKASSIENIANLLANNKTKAIGRIIDGDLETYLIHIDQRNMAKDIEQVKIRFKDDKESLFSNVLNILRGIKDDADVGTDLVEVDDRQTLLAIISRDAPVKEMVQYLLKRKTREKLNRRILGESKDRESLDEFLCHKNVSFVCLCMNYLRNFPDESNASGYKNIYEMYANYVLDILIEKNAFSLFYSGFKQLVNMEYVSQTFKDKLNETSIRMQGDFEQFCKTVNKKSKRKSILGF